MNATPWEIAQTIHPHPTLSRSIGEAALAVYGKAIHSSIMFKTEHKGSVYDILLRHEHLGLTDKMLLEMYETMLLARRIDERMWLLNRAGKIPFVISCQGQEAAQVGAAFALDRDKRLCASLLS